MLKLYALFLLLIVSSVARSQCTQGLGTPIVNETFGSGTAQIGPQLPPGKMTMFYSASSCPLDGTYSIINYTTGCFTEWHTVTDHTGDKNGYFLVIDASTAPSDFWVQTITGLCEGTTYQFAAYVFNMFRVTYGINPDLSFTIEKPDGTVLQKFDSGPIVMTDSVIWNKESFYFKTPPGVSTVVFRMRNNAPGGRGNDLAIDDITITPAGPKTTIGINGIAGNVLDNPCYTGPVNFSSNVESCYTKNAYQWQSSTDSLSWHNIPGANQPDYTFLPLKSGACYFRLVVGEDRGMGSISCGVNSNVLKVVSHTIDPPKISNITTTICPANPFLLPSGKYASVTGLYKDVVYNQYGCDSIITNLDLTVRNRPNLGTTKLLCIGDSVVLSPGIFKSYVWQDGSRNPTYTVRAPGTYTVKVTDEEGCETADTLIINRSSCSIIVPPNTFTPNGDGINDTWRIEGLQNFPRCTVYVYSRWGSLIFKSIGYPNAWDGTYNGKPLPEGTYYYIINLENNFPPVSGYITIIK